MGLGNNRDYKTSERSARKALAIHAGLMAELLKTGITRDEASAEAYKQLMAARYQRRANLMKKRAR